MRSPMKCVLKTVGQKWPERIAENIRSKCLKSLVVWERFCTEWGEVCHAGDCRIETSRNAGKQTVYGAASSSTSTATLGSG